MFASLTARAAAAAADVAGVIGVAFARVVGRARDDDATVARAPSVHRVAKSRASLARVTSRARRCVAPRAMQTLSPSASRGARDAASRARASDGEDARPSERARATHRAVVKIQNAVRRYMRAKRGRGRDGRDGEDAATRAMRDVRARGLKCSLLVLVWFSTGTGLALFNKQILGVERGGFPCPIFLTSMQFAMQYAMARACLGAGVLEDAEKARGKREEVPSEVYWRNLAPVGAAMALDIALSNLSLAFITVSVYTVAKTSTIVFTLGLAFLFRFERPTWFLGGVVTLVVVGQVMSVEGDAQFDVFGFIMCLIAALMSALRWIFSQRVMHRDRDEPGDHAKGIKDSHHVSHPVVFVSLIYPIMFVIVFTFSSLKERWWFAIPHSKWLASPIDVFVDLVVFACGASMAFCLTLAEFELLNETSAMSMMFIGVLKDIINIVCGMLLFGDKFGSANVVGLGLCMVGVVGYNKYKWEQLKLKALTSQRRGDDSDAVPLVEITSISSTSPRRRLDDFTIA